MKYIKKINWSVLMVLFVLVAAGVLSSCKNSRGGATTSGGGISTQSVVTLKGASS